jgi:hypothetical protein
MSANFEQHSDRLLVLRVGELRKSELDAAQSEFVEKIAGAGTVKFLMLLENFTGWERGEAWGDMIRTFSSATAMTSRKLPSSAIRAGKHRCWHSRARVLAKDR